MKVYLWRPQRKNNVCVSCGNNLVKGELVTTKRCRNKCRIRCKDCSKKYGLID